MHVYACVYVCMFIFWLYVCTSFYVTSCKYVYIYIIISIYVVRKFKFPD